VSDLAGLSPEHISAALQLGLQSETVDQKKRADLVDMLYKNALVGQAQQKINQVEPLDRPFVGGLSLRQFNSLPTDVKEYVLVKSASGLDDDFMTKREWETLRPTEREKYIKALRDNPELFEIAKDLAKAGATTIGESVLKSEALAEQKRIDELRKPSVVTEIEKRYDAAEVQRSYGTDVEELAQTMPYDKALEKVRKAVVRQDLDRQIRDIFPEAEVEYRLHDGWYVDGELFRRDPYGIE